MLLKDYVVNGIVDVKMMKTKNGLSMLVFMLSVVLVAALAFQANYLALQNTESPVDSPLSEPQQSPEVQGESSTEEVNIEALSPFGGLSTYDLVLNYEPLERLKVPSSLSIEPISLSNETAMDIGINVFQMPQVAVIKKMPWDGLLLKQDNKELTFFGLNRIYYSEVGIKPVVESWDEERVLQIAEDFLRNLSAYWQYESEVTYQLNSIHPSWNTTVNDPLTKTETEITRAIGVSYRLYVDNIELVGPGADFSIWVADDRVIDVEINRPSIAVGEEMANIKSQEEALEYFIQGKSDAASIGFQILYPIIPPEGNCTVSSVKLVYYIDFSKEQQSTIPLLYEIRGTLSYIDPIDAESKAFEFVDYQFATKDR